MGETAFIHNVRQRSYGSLTIRIYLIVGERNIVDEDEQDCHYLQIELTTSENTSCYLHHLHWEQEYRNERGLNEESYP